MARDFARGFYKSKEWQTVREYVRMRDRYLCVRCGAYGEEVHHKIHLTPENIYDEAITLNPNNLELLCFACHKKEHKIDVAIAQMKDKDKQEIAKQLENNYMFDDNGMLVKK